MAGFGIRVMKWSYNRIKSRDIFKQTVSLTFRGRESYTTLISGVVTIIITILLTILGIFLAKRMFERSDVEWNTNVRFVDRYNDSSKYTIKPSDGIIIVINVFSYLKFEPGYNFERLVKPQIFQIRNIKNKTEASDFTSKNVNVSFSCEDKKYRSIIDLINSDADNYGVNITNFSYWLDFAGLNFGGVYSGIEYNGISIFFRPWALSYDNNDWEHINKSNAFLSDNSTWINFLGYQTKIDLDDIKDPIKKNMISLYRYNNPNKNGVVQLAFPVQIIELTKEDGLFGFDPFVPTEKILSFNPINNVITEFKDGSIENYTSILTILHLHTDTAQYKRKVFNFLELIGILGGIFGIFDLLFGMILGSMSTYMFKRDLKHDISEAERKYSSLKLMIEDLK